MQKWDLFAYLAAFVTIVLAIALTDMIQSAHRMLRARNRVRWDILTPLLALWVFLWVLSEFFSLWIDARYERINFFALVALMIVPIFTALAAYAVLPDEVPPEGLDLNRFYFDNLGYLIFLLALINLADVARVIVYAFRFDGFDEFEPWIPWLIQWSAFFGLLVFLYFVRARWAQVTGLVLLFLRIAGGMLGGGYEIQATAGI